MMESVAEHTTAPPALVPWNLPQAILAILVYPWLYAAVASERERQHVLAWAMSMVVEGKTEGILLRS